MRIHQSGLQAIMIMLSVALIDLFTRKVYLFLLYVSGLAYLLFRSPDRVPSMLGIISPVSGIVNKVYKSKVGEKIILCIEINTRPIIDSQTFRLIPGEVVSENIHGQCIQTKYESGILVEHAPRLGFWNPVRMHGPSNGYGYSFFGSETQITLPGDFETRVLEGQRVIDNETTIARRL